MSKKTLVGPTLDYSLSDTLWRVRGEVPKKPFSGSKALNAGDRIWEYEVEDLKKYDRGFLGMVFKSAFDAPPLDASLEAPVDGVYKHSSSDTMFGRIDGYGYSPEKARQNNAPPETLEELYNRRTASNLPLSYSFIAAIDSDKKITGSDLYSKFFDKLLSNSEPISEWLSNSSGNFSVDVPEFWDSVKNEQRRLNSIECPILPYDAGLFR